MSLSIPPKGEYLAWVINHPEQVAAYLETVYALEHLEIALGVNVATQRFPVRVGGRNAVITLPATVRLPSAIADAITNTLSNTTTINTLLADLRTIGVLPRA